MMKVIESQFNDAYPEAYVETYQGYDGGDVFTKLDCRYKMT